MKIAKLIITIENQNKEFLITEDFVNIGRAAGSNVALIIDHPTVSRLHASIFRNAGKFFIEDRSTYQRTYLNGKNLEKDQKYELRDQDRLRLGSVQARFILEKIHAEDEGLLSYEAKAQSEELKKKAEATAPGLLTSPDGMVQQKRVPASLASPEPIQSPPPLRKPPAAMGALPMEKPKPTVAQPIEANFAEADEAWNSEEPVSYCIEAEAIEENPPEANEPSLAESEEESLTGSVVDGEEQEEALVAEKIETIQSSIAPAMTSIEEPLSATINEEGEVGAIAVEDSSTSFASFAIMAEEENSEEAEEAQEAKIASSEVPIPVSTLKAMPDITTSLPTGDDDSAVYPGWETKSLIPEILCLNPKKIVTLQKEVTIFGTGDKNDVSLPSEEWDKVQMSFIFDPDQKQYFLKKLGKAETKVNGKIIENLCPLQDGDMVQAGEYSFYFFDAKASYPALQRALRIYCKNTLARSFQAPFQEAVKRYEKFDGKLFYEFKIFGRDDEVIAFCVKENSYGVYIFFGEIEVKNLNYRILPWLQGIFDATVGYLEDCKAILKEMNNHIMQTCHYLPLDAMIMRINASQISFACAGKSAGIYQRSKGSQEILWTKGMPLGLQENYFAEESSLAWESGDTLLLFTNSCFKLPYKDGSQKKLQQKELAKLLGETIQAKGRKKIFENLQHTLEDKIKMDRPCLLSVVTFASSASALKCTTCGKEYPLEFKFCPVDGATLQKEE